MKTADALPARGEHSPAPLNESRDCRRSNGRVGDCSPPSTLEARIAQLELELGVLRGLARDELVTVIAGAVGDHVFTSQALWRHRRAHPVLRDALRAAGIRDARQLGLWLARLRGGMVCSVTLESVKRDNRGRVWFVRIDS